MTTHARGILTAAALAALSAAPCVVRAQLVSPGAGKQWATTWSAEFNNGASDLSGWSYDVGGGGWGNNEVQTYTAPPGSPPPAANPLGLPGQQTTPSVGTNTSNVFVATEPTTGTGALHVDAIG